MNANASLMMMAVALSACLAPHDRGEPLYPRMDPPPKPEELAHLGGYVRVVDDQQVTEGKSFDLLPGCHIISTPARWGRVEPQSGGTTVDTGHQTFALVMKPGHRYFIDVKVKMMGGSTGSAVLQAREEDPSGKTTQVLGPAHSFADIENCKQAGSRLAP
ncbi:MAG TPA: hypothetical protein VGA51_11990 [Casimicrobiaceae bacterium]